MRNTKKIVAIVLAAVLLVSAVVVGTLAWLMSKPDAITNTFTVGNVAITLTETYGPDYTNVMPGDKLAKDPVVTVQAGSAACWLFIEVLNDTDNQVAATVSDIWTKAEDVTPKTEKATVYYCEAPAVASDGTAATYYILTSETGNDVAGNSMANGHVVVSSDYAGDGNTKLGNGITFKAYAIQKANIDGYQTAWTEVTK